jgi:hypothetical protein
VGSKQWVGVYMFCPTEFMKYKFLAIAIMTFAAAASVTAQGTGFENARKRLAMNWHGCRRDSSKGPIWIWR